MPRKKKTTLHSKYSPSSAYIWLNCPAALGVCDTLPKVNKVNKAAEEGTKYHEIMEKFLKKYTFNFFENDSTYEDFLKATKLERSKMTFKLFESMEYLSLYIFTHAGKATIKMEERIILDSIIPGCFGTADIVVKKGEHLFIIDYKFGHLSVQPESEQLMLYCIGALEKYNDKKDIKRISSIIVQPKLARKPRVSHFSVKKIRTLKAEYHKQAARILHKKPKCIVGPHCDHYAPCQAYCKAYKKEQIKKTKKAFEDAK